MVPSHPLRGFLSEKDQNNDEDEYDKQNMIWNFSLHIMSLTREKKMQAFVITDKVY